MYNCSAIDMICSDDDIPFIAGVFLVLSVASIISGFTSIDLKLIIEIIAFLIQ